MSISFPVVWKFHIDNIAISIFYFLLQQHFSDFFIIIWNDHNKYGMSISFPAVWKFHISNIAQKMAIRHYLLKKYTIHAKHKKSPTTEKKNNIPN